MSLRRRVLGLISLVLLISLGTGMVLTYWHAQKKVRVEMEAAISVGASATRDSVEMLVKHSEPARQLQRIISSFNGDRHVQAFWIGPTGASIADSTLLAPSEYVPSWFFDLFAGAPHTATVSLPAKVADLGQIRLVSDSHNEVEEIWEDLALKSLIVVAFTFLLLTLVYQALGHALRPLETLSMALVRVGGGDYAIQVPVTGPLELSAIYAEFNRMAGRLAESEQHNRRLDEQLTRVQEEERADIARDLHDEFGPFLFSIDVDARSIRKAHEQRPGEDIGAGADAIRASVAHMQTHLKSILGRLRPNALLDLGLSHALDHLVEFWRGRHPQIAFVFDIDQTSYGARTDDVCYRIVQESVNNAVRHGRPTEVLIAVALQSGSFVDVLIRDNGVGLNSAASKGFGLLGMRERIVAAGGSVSVANGPGGAGVQIMARLPLGDEREAVAAVRCAHEIGDVSR